MSKNLLLKFFTLITLIACTLSAQAQCDVATPVGIGNHTVDSIPPNGVEIPVTVIQPSGSLWFAYTHEIESRGTLTVSSCIDGIADTRLSVYTNTCADLEFIDINDEGCDDFGSSKIEFRPELGQTYYIIWDSRWSAAGFDWTISFEAQDIPDFDLAVSGEAAGTKIPVHQANNGGIPLTMNVANLGWYDLTNVNLNAIVYKLVDNNRSIVANFDHVLGNVEPVTEIAPITLGNFETDELGNYEVEFAFTMDEVEASAQEGNNTATLAFQVTENTYALENGENITTINTQGYSNVTQGQNYYFSSPDQLESVDLDIDNGEGVNLALKIFTTDEDGKPAEELYSQNFSSDNNDWTTVELSTPLNLDAGTYFVGVYSPSTQSIDLNADQNYFYPGNTWMDISLFSGESLWLSLDAYEMTYLIRLNTKNHLTSILSTDLLAGTVNVQPNPSNGLFTLNYDLEKLSDLTISIVNALGQTIHERKINQTQNNSATFDLSNLNTGIYTILLSNGKQINSQRIIIE